jgi:hypothetical protein
MHAWLAVISNPNANGGRSQLTVKALVNLGISTTPPRLDLAAMISVHVRTWLTRLPV